MLNSDFNNSNQTWVIDRPEVTISNPHVTGNGNQQVLVRFYVEARVGKDPVKLTGSEKDKLCLVDYYDKETVIPFDKYNELGWKASRIRDIRFDYYQASVTGVKSNSQGTMAGGEVFDFYLSCNDPYASPLKIAVKVTGDNGKVFITNGESFDSSGEPMTPVFPLPLTPEINVHPPVYYDASRFLLGSPVDIIDSTDIPQAAIFNQGIFLSLSPDGSRQLALRKLDADPAGMIHWQTPDVDDRTPCFIGFASPGETLIQWNSDENQVPTGSQPLPELTKSYTDPNKCMIVMCGRNDIRQGDYPSGFGGPCLLSVTDIHGTTHKLKILFVADQRNEIIISD
ncbi:hypothetical protein [Erwinia aphidicola]|uniref:hypothetical protein n=1 Tax=Erwinia aphidicola TaxID=68334 RepID=UPI00209E8300|nr:hypothetical protein [Erwinia aphidicola]MCP2234047.1 hypothetical protein [Erwinia aphidicola]